MKGSEVVLRWRHPVTDDELFQLTAATAAAPPEVGGTRCARTASGG